MAEDRNLMVMESVDALIGHPKSFVKAVQDYVRDITVVPEPDSLTIEFGPRERTEMGYRLVGPQENTMSGHATFVDGSKHDTGADGLILTEAVVEFPWVSAEQYDIEDIESKLETVMATLGDPEFIRATTRRDGPNWTPMFLVEYDPWVNSGRSHSKFNRAMSKLAKLHRDFAVLDSEPAE